MLRKCLQILYLIYLYKVDLALNYLQWLICYKTKLPSVFINSHILSVSAFMDIPPTALKHEVSWVLPYLIILAHHLFIGSFEFICSPRLVTPPKSVHSIMFIIGNGISNLGSIPGQDLCFVLLCANAFQKDMNPSVLPPPAMGK